MASKKSLASFIAMYKPKLAKKLQVPKSKFKVLKSPKISLKTSNALNLKLRVKKAYKPSTKNKKS